MSNEVMRKSLKDNVKVKNEKNNKYKQILTGAIFFGSAFLLIAAIILGTFYFIIHSNINGFTDKYRNNIVKVPILKNALPKVDAPDDLSKLTQEEILNKFIELKKANDELNNKYNLVNKEIGSTDEQIQALKQQLAEAEKKNSEANLQIKQSDEYVKKVNELLASGNKAGFKEYYEKVDKVTAQKIYSEIIQEQKATEEAKKFIQLYETIDPAVTAKILEEMGTDKIDLIALILKSMKNDISAEIIAGMQTPFAAKVTDKLSVLIKP